MVLEDDFAGTEALANRFAADSNGKVRHIYKHALNGFAAVLPRTAVNALAELPQVKYIESDAYVTADGGPIERGHPAVAAMLEGPPVETNPPWHLDRIDQRPSSLDSMYTRLHTGAGVNIYVVDSGIDTDHPEFDGRVYEGGFTIQDGRGIEDCFGHGTWVAGIAGGATLGVANEAYLTIMRIMGCEGSASASDAEKAFDWIAGDNYPVPSVVIYSYTGEKASLPSLETAIQRVIDGGIPVVTSAEAFGENDCNYSPNNMEDIITVGATSKSDAIWIGPLIGDPQSNSGTCLNIWAPGEAILTADIGGGTTSRSGTSYAAPQVAGAVALLLEDDPTRTPAQISSTLDYIATVKTISGALDGSPNRLLYAPYYYSYTGGPTEVESGSSYEWYHVPYGGGGYTPDSYEWWYTPDGGSSSLVATTATYSRYISDGDPNFSLYVITTIGSVTDTATAKGVTVDPFEDPCLTNPELVCIESVAVEEGG